MPPKHINVLLNGQLPAVFSLEFREEDGKTVGILTAPHVKWADMDTPYVVEDVVTIRGQVLECIEKYYFDKNVVTIPVQGFLNSVDILDIVYKIIPPEIYDKMLDGTFIVDEKADPEMYSQFSQFTPR
jgi:hypothetical protein